ncbi:MAG: 4-hydroxy-tetrahydrodipicolinate synthase, partial [Actinobacteria bacterium]|nr:4-hydroxy-tetrahydrodipicolinate synthase [Actinomycetota bacterium]
AMVTPFGEAGELCLDEAATLAKYLVAHGSDAIVVSGTTGEGPVLTDEERISLVEAVVKAVDVPVIAGTGTNDTAHSIAMTKLAEGVGAAGALVVTPYYNRPSQAGITAHLEAVCAASKLPVILYDIPARTGRGASLATVLDLAARVENLVAIKDATGDVSRAVEIIAASSDDFVLYSGDDSLTLPLLSVGATGVIAVASHWAGEAMGEMIAAYKAGDVAKAQAINEGLLPSWRFEGSDAAPNPIPAKAACRALGLKVGQCRLPLGDCPPEVDAAAKALVAQR